MRKSWLRVWMSGWAVALAGWWMTGCVIVPVPAPTKIESAKGPTSLETKTFKAGETTRAAAEQGLESVRVPMESESVVWARYSKSSSALFIAAGGYGGAAVGGGRNWGIHNLFVTFNADGKIESMRDVHEKELNAVMSGYLKSGAVTVKEDFAEEVVLEVSHWHYGTDYAPLRLTLKKSELVIEEYWNEKHSFHVKPQDVRQISMGYEGSHPDPGKVAQVLRFLDEKGKQRKMALMVKPQEVPVLQKYLDTVTGAQGEKKVP